MIKYDHVILLRTMFISVLLVYCRRPGDERRVITNGHVQQTTSKPFSRHAKFSFRMKKRKKRQK